MALRDGIFRILYWLAYQVRGIVWAIQRPTLLGVRILVLRDNQVLLIRHRAGSSPWALPGGGVESQERWIEAARREVYEEAGIDVQIEYLMGMYEAFRGELANYIAVFVATSKAEPNPPQSLEIAEARFFPTDALPHGLEAGSKRRILEYTRGQRGLAELW